MQLHPQLIEASLQVILETQSRQDAPAVQWLLPVVVCYALLVILKLVTNGAHQQQHICSIWQSSCNLQARQQLQQDITNMSQVSQPRHAWLAESLSTCAASQLLLVVGRGLSSLRPCSALCCHTCFDKQLPLSAATLDCCFADGT